MVVASVEEMAVGGNVGGTPVRHSFLMAAAVLVVAMAEGE